MEKQKNSEIRKFEEEIWARINRKYNAVKIREQSASNNVSNCQYCHGCRNCRSCSND